MSNFSDNLPQPFEGFHYRKSDGFFIINSTDIDRAISVMLRNNFKKLEVNSLFYESKDISTLRNFQFIECLNLVKDDVDLTPINTLKNLVDVSIQSVNEKYKGYVNFGGFDKLTKCSVDWSVPGAETIYDSKSLKDLAIYKFDEFELFRLGGLSNLRSLTLNFACIVSIQGISGLKSLKEFQLFGCRNLESLNCLEELANIEKVCIEKCDKINSLENIGSLVQLKYLDFSDMGNVKSLSFLKNLTKIETIYFAGNTNILDGDLQILKYLKEKGKLNDIVFKNRKHYDYKREQLGYKLDPQLAKIFHK